jgi:aminobenzoyl-glutamate utilization protein B
LELQGFRVTKNVAGIPTAVVGEAGEDGPVIAILGEYDALPGLGQEAGVAEAKPLAAAGRRSRPWLRPQPARRGVHAGGDCG